MSDDTSSFGKWTPLAAIVLAAGSGIFNAISANSGDTNQKDFTAANAEVAFEIMGYLREDLQRQIDDLKAELRELGP